MAASSVGSTDPELLRRVARLWDDPAWREFFERYAPFVRDRCSVHGLDPVSVDELCQRIWVELAQRMPVFQYDPGRSFRGWLRRLCRHRAIDLYRERQNHHVDSLDDGALAGGLWTTEDGEEWAEDGELPTGRLRLLREAIAVQEDVRRQVKPVRWESFWRVVIEDQSVSDVAASLGLKYATVYAGVNHVAELLRAEGRRRQVTLGLDDASHRAEE